MTLTDRTERIRFVLKITMTILGPIVLILSAVAWFGLKVWATHCLAQDCSPPGSASASTAAPDSTFRGIIEAAS